MGHICTRWRAVALATPHLWNFVLFDLDRYAKGDNRSFEIAEELLRRSGRSQVSCTIRHLKQRSSPIDNAFRLLLSHASRTRYLTINGIHSLSYLTKFPCFPLTSLETLDLLCKTSKHSSIQTSSMTLFDDAPNLRWVALSSDVRTSRLHPIFLRHPDLLSLHLPWVQLTHLRLSGFVRATYHSTHALLNQCTNLVDCNLFIPENEHGPQTFPLIELHYLETLKLANDSPGDYGQFLQYLAFPALKRLTLIETPFVTRWSQHHLVDLLRRSACDLEAFQLKGLLSEVFLLTLIEEMPSLKRLSLREPSCLPRIIGRMVKDGFLPGLQWLECPIFTVDSALEDLKPNLGEYLAESNPPASISCKCAISLVIDQTCDKRDEAMVQLRKLERQRVKFSLRRWQVFDFMDYSGEAGIAEWHEPLVSYSNRDDHSDSGDSSDWEDGSDLEEWETWEDED